MTNAMIPNENSQSLGEYVSHFFGLAGWDEVRSGDVQSANLNDKCPHCGCPSDQVRFIRWADKERVVGAVLELHECTHADRHDWDKCYIGPLEQPMDVARRVACGSGYRLTLSNGEVLRSGWLSPSES